MSTLKEKIQKIKEKLKGLRMDFDALLDEIIETAETVEPTKTNKTEIDFDNLLDEPEKINVSEDIKNVDVNVDVDINIEYGVETDAYVKAKLQLEEDLKAIKQEMKDLQDEFKEMGVDTKNVNKAINEIKKELKETPDEAKSVTQMKARFKNDKTIFTNIALSIE